MDKRIYPCIITKDDDIYYANFVDLDNCFTDGETLEEILNNSKDVLNAVTFSMLKNNIEIPKPSNFDIKLKNNQFIIGVDLWLDPLKEKVKNQSIKKNLTIPKWLNDEAEKSGVNFSNILQIALKQYLGITK